MSIANYRQHAAAEIAIGLGHLDAAIALWSPSLGLSPAQENKDDAVLAWRRFTEMVEELRQFVKDEGP